MSTKNSEALIKYRQGLFSRIKNTIIKLFNDGDDVKTANIGHDRLYQVLAEDRIKNQDVRVTPAKTKTTTETKKTTTKTTETDTKKKTKSNKTTTEAKTTPKNDTKKKKAKPIKKAYSDEEVKKISYNPKNAKNELDELIKILDILKENGIETRKIRTTKNVNKHHKPTELIDINQTEIDMTKIIVENKLPYNYPIGRKIELIRRRVNNVGKYKRDISSTKINHLVELGIIAKN